MSVRTAEPEPAAPEPPPPTKLTDADGRLSLARALEVALERNPRVLAARAGLDAAAARRPQVTKLPDPVFRLGWYAESIETRTGPQKLVIGVSQRVPWPGKLSIAGDLADIGRDQAQVNEWIAARDALVAVTRAHHELLYLHGAVRVTGLIEAVLQRLVAVAARGREPGLTRLPEVIRAETLVAQVGYDAVMLRELLVIEEEKLRALLSLPPDAQLGVPETLVLPTLDVPVRQLQNHAARHSQEVLLATLRLEHARRSIEAAAYRSRPDFTVGGRYIVTEERDDLDPSGNGDDPIYAEVGVTLPIHGAANQAAVTEAQALWRRRVHARQAVLDGLRADVAEAWWKANNAHRLMQLYRQTLLPQAERAARAAETLYVEGQAAYAGVLETVAAWHHFELAALRARADYGQALARLEQLLGTPLDAAPTGGRQP